MNSLHHQFIFKRRVSVLAAEIAKRLPENASVLDVGCGSGDIAASVLRLRPDVTINGVDVLVRPGTAIEVREFDGVTLPTTDGSYDVVMFIDVLHHTDDPAALQQEAARVCRNGVLIKDHFCENFFSLQTLRIMDWVGNVSHGVRLPYNYLARSQWKEIWSKIGIFPKLFSDDIKLYIFPLNIIFGRKLHFITLLEKK